MTAATDQPLAGLGVLVTRPTAQAEPLCAKIEAAGGRAIRYPTLEIEPLTIDESLRVQAEQAAAADWTIFVSANAVQCYVDAELPTPTGRIAAIGSATANAIAALGLPQPLQPDSGFDTEALLNQPELDQVAAQRVTIVRGEGGREQLAEALRERGAEVDYLELYRRRLPRQPALDLEQSWQTIGIDVVTATSNAVLNNLHTLLRGYGRSELNRSPLVVVSDRMLQLAQQLGLQGELIRAANPTDDAIMAALHTWADQQRTEHER